MQPWIKESLLEILHLINYSQNKEKFILEFEAMSHVEAMTAMIQKLPKDLQKRIASLDKNSEEIKQYISSDEYLVEVDRISRQELQSFVKVVSPVLSVSQKEKIAFLLQK
jgi:hypothetical protein